ncbi:hypothetical protein PPACK8108_LOCUS22025 [Phakopsora pachyrhizi]|uniref:Uncharacterized protein n=1 Tax=Phakopsora pachyrhizi TaxID=170000 RepID=A0AAV0BMB9_PHAPC|nr:hypothetical protein PPACK8108_LOCUS22025 [Phakopsora pachyrhizi]
MYEVDRLVGGEVEFWGTKEEEELKSNTGSLGEEDAENYGLQKNKDVKKDKDGKKDKSDHKDEKSCAKKLIKAKNFTQHINTLDADKPIMQRKAAINSGADESTEPILKGLDAVASLNSRDELYKIAKNYRIKRKSVIPKLKYQSYRKAKWILTKQRAPQTQQQNLDSQEHFSADRFLLPNHIRQHAMPELETLQIAKLEKEGSSEEAKAMRREFKRKVIN